MTTTTLNASVTVDTNSGAVLDVRVFDTPTDAIVHSSEANHDALSVGYAPDHRAVLIVATDGTLDHVIGLNFDADDTSLHYDIERYERDLPPAV